MVQHTHTHNTITSHTLKKVSDINVGAGIREESYFATSPMFHDHVEGATSKRPSSSRTLSVVEGDLHLGGALHWYPYTNVPPLPLPLPPSNHRHAWRPRSLAWSG